MKFKKKLKLKPPNVHYPAPLLWTQQGCRSGADPVAFGISLCIVWNMGACVVQIARTEECTSVQQATESENQSQG